MNAPGAALDLVDDDETSQGLEGEKRIGQAGQVVGALEVEDGDGAGSAGSAVPGQRGLADLAGSHDRHDGVGAQGAIERRQVAGPVHWVMGTT